MLYEELELKNKNAFEDAKDESAHYASSDDDKIHKLDDNWYLVAPVSDVRRKAHLQRGSFFYSSSSVIYFCKRLVGFSGIVYANFPLSIIGFKNFLVRYVRFLYPT